MTISRTEQLNCLIVDDEPAAVHGIIDYLGRVPFKGNIRTAYSPEEALEVVDSCKVDFMFLDINMPGMTGLEFLKSLNRAPLAVFTTAYSEYALDGYQLGVVDYLLKPIDFARFEDAFRKLVNTYHSQILLRNHAGPKEIYIQNGESYLKLLPCDVVFVEAMQNYVKLHLQSGSHIIHQTMRGIQEVFSALSFFRAHKSYLINTCHLKQVCKNHVVMEGGIKLPLSKYRKKELLEVFVHPNTVNK